jgi:hypothetical protein
MFSGFYPVFTDGLKTSENIWPCAATLLRILGLWSRSIVEQDSTSFITGTITPMIHPFSFQHSEKAFASCIVPLHSYYWSGHSDAGPAGSCCWWTVILDPNAESPLSSPDTARWPSTPLEWPYLGLVGDASISRWRTFSRGEDWANKPYSNYYN